MEIESLLFRLVSEKFKGLRDKQFAKKIEDEVAELDELVCVRQHTAKVGTFGESTIYVMHNGLVVLLSEAGCWTLYESQERVEERELHLAWANFTRGAWVKGCPKEAGQYFCKDLDLGRRTVRELRKIEGRLLDVSGGYVPPGKVTVWAGYWWSERIPRLPGSY
jgi:hypothetical protein